MTCQPVKKYSASRCLSPLKVIYMERLDSSFVIEANEVYEVPFCNTIKPPVPNELFSPEEFFRFIPAFRLRDGIRPGDLELFVGEHWVNTGAFSTSFFLRHFFFENPDEAAKANAYRESRGIKSLSSFISYVEATYGPSMMNDQDKWTYIFCNTPRLAEYFSSFLRHESLDSCASRMVKIKQKISRMPDLDATIEEDGEVLLKDALPGYLHPRDTALIGSLGMLIGVTVTRTSSSRVDYYCIDFLHHHCQTNNNTISAKEISYWGVIETAILLLLVSYPTGNV